MMSVNILRWNGGSGGDMLIRMITASSDANTNVQFFSSVTDQGAIQLDQSHLNFDDLRQIDRIALSKKYMSKLDPCLLKKELDVIVANGQSWCIKSHYYKQDFYNNLIVDIVVDPTMLPFAVAANINKTKTMQFNFNQLVSKIAEPKIRYQYSVYNVAKDIATIFDTNRVIQLKQLLSGWEELKNITKQFNVVLDENLKTLYNNWVDVNKKYLPTSTYQYLVSAKEYDITHPNLTLIEKYCLLVMSGSKFQLLDKNEI